MWSILNGTIVNAGTVALGTGLGVLFSARIPDRYHQIILTVLGLVTVTLGVDAAVNIQSAVVERYGPRSLSPNTYGALIGMLVVVSLVVGALIGTALRLHERIEGLGGVIHRHFGGTGDAHRFVEGFLTASVIFCVGPLTLLGCLRNGMAGDPSYLYIKAALDGFCSLALATALGWGVAFSILTVLCFQGGLSCLAYGFAGVLPDLSVQLMNVTGGVMLIATALLLLDLKRIPVANLLPGLFLPPLAVFLAEVVQPGLLLPPGAGG
ncbi:MAG: DUF554 domain-containing protein [bacterium]|nr:DUF554 domain-containing protein [bacterium]